MAVVGAVAAPPAGARARHGCTGGRAPRGADAPDLATLARLWRLAEAPTVDVVRGLPALLEHPDPEVVTAAEEFAGTASGPVLSMLWGRHAFTPRIRELLLDNPLPLPDDAVNVAWSVWLYTPDRRVWEKIDGRTATHAERRVSHIVLGLATPAETWAAALSGGTSDVVVAHAMTICRDRGYAPDDPLERAALFVLTGQAARYRELDPESVLLTHAYQRAPQRLRRRLRASMSELEGIDLVGVVCGDGRRAMTETERDYLVRGLTSRRAWEELWRLVLHLPLAQAIPVARMFDGWRPAESRDRALFDCLLSVQERDLRRLSTQAQALFERPPHLLRKAIPKYLDRADPVMIDLLRARLAHRNGDAAS
ncbi:hypothetical protein Pflav_059720 [Phytohabitans flavus]|uniref:Uncharacterized protein n=1 Tax=Phytohabitans flavus TaxID=1076124 RepID=A0A6F8Y0C2_9ACTN|nr:hypothetical protein [Phytohabitans flavus]BCB79562.1 hypothetical protein Pflav_059720 [Phytohabitans flavus]